MGGRRPRRRVGGGGHRVLRVQPPAALVAVVAEPPGRVGPREPTGRRDEEHPGDPPRDAGLGRRGCLGRGQTLGGGWRCPPERLGGHDREGGRGGELGDCLGGAEGTGGGGHRARLVGGRAHRRRGRHQHRGEDGGPLREEGRERLAHRRHGRVAIARIDEERALHRLRDRARHPGRDARERRHGRVAHLQDEVAHRRGPVEGGVPREGLVEHDAQRPDVGPLIDGLLAAGLLGRHVERRADDGAGLGERPLPLLRPHLAGHDLGDAEVQHLEQPLPAVALRQEEVRRLDVAVEDALRVGLLQAQARLHADAQGEPLGEGAEPREEALHVLADQELHGEERRAGSLVPPRVEDLHDVLGLDDARGPRLLLEAAHRARIVAQVAGDHLEGDALARPVVARLVHGAHPALAQAADDGVLASDDLSSHAAREDKRERTRGRACGGPAKGRGCISRPTARAARRARRRRRASPA